MELLSSPKTSYMLEANLEVLHEETTEWLNDINYWRDEIAFFYTLMVKKIGKGMEGDDQEEIGHIQDELLHINQNKLDELQQMLETHERNLSALLDGVSLHDERSYRDKHKVILGKVRNINERIRSLKREIFSLVKKYN